MICHNNGLGTLKRQNDATTRHELSVHEFHIILDYDIIQQRFQVEDQS